MSTAFAKDLLAGKVAYVAGGTRGMNLEIAKRYAEHGAKVAVMSRNPERAEKAAEEIRAIGPGAIGFACDVRDYDAVADTFAKTAEELGKVDLVVAGQAGNFYAPAKTMTSKGFRTIIDIDLIGTFNVFRAGFEYLVRPGASLLAITAPEAQRPLHFQSHVCSAKAAVNMLLRCLALEWGPAGIRVNGISPGPIEDSWGMNNVAAQYPEMKKQIADAVPLGRWGDKAEIADGALFLASDAAQYVTGTILDVDGGISVISPESGKVDAVFEPEKDPRILGSQRPAK